MRPPMEKWVDKRAGHKVAGERTILRRRLRRRQIGPEDGVEAGRYLGT